MELTPHTDTSCCRPPLPGNEQEEEDEADTTGPFNEWLTSARHRSAAAALGSDCVRCREKSRTGRKVGISASLLIRRPQDPIEIACRAAAAAAAFDVSVFCSASSQRSFNQSPSPMARHGTKRGDDEGGNGFPFKVSTISCAACLARRHLPGMFGYCWPRRTLNNFSKWAAGCRAVRRDLERKLDFSSSSHPLSPRVH